MHIPFNEDYLVSSDNYTEAMNREVLPYLASREKTEMIIGCDGKPLYCVTYRADNPVATVLIVHGFTENAYKYSELIFSLLHQHYAVVAYDQRGHGRSWRDERLTDPSVTHVDRFEEYVADLKAVCDHYLPFMPQPALVFAHSMGGAVVSLFLEEFQDVFSSAVLCAPMIAPQTKGVPRTAVRCISCIASFLGRGRKHPFFMKPWTGPEKFNTSCATDPARFGWYDAVKTANKCFRNSVPSYRWTAESVSVTGKILFAGAPERISCPVLLFTAEKDYSVAPEPQTVFINRVPHGRHVFVKGARHEIYRSTNEVLFPWWHQILDFWAESVPPASP